MKYKIKNVGSRPINIPSGVIMPNEEREVDEEVHHGDLVCTKTVLKSNTKKSKGGKI